MGLDEDYKRAVIRLIRDLPKILETINRHTMALTEHTEQLKKA